jgi:TRAP-type C4-dicarboxylate transport system substrate-binding protein
MRHVLMILIFSFVAAGVTTAQSTTTWLIYASANSPNHPFSRADKTWIRWVEESSGGTLRIRAIWGGALISSDQSLLELRHGVADIGTITPIYVRGSTHLLRTQAGFYSGAKTFEQQVALYRCLAEASPQYEHETEGLKILAIQGGTLPGILTRDRPIYRLDDLKGLRIRVPSELIRVMRDLGVDAVTSPMVEVYSALAKGILDGVVAAPDPMKSMHFSEVAHYYTRLEVPRGAYPARAMGLRRWKSLSEAHREILEESIPVWEAALSKEIAEADNTGEAEGRRQGIVFIDIPPADQRRFDALYEKDAERSARALGRLGIEGESVFRQARRIAQGIELTGKVICAEDGTGRE